MRLVPRSIGLAAVIAVVSAMGASVAGAQASSTVCKDGTASATAGRGACSGHGGVDAAKSAAAKASMKASAKKSAKAEAKVDARAEAKADAKADRKADAKAEAKADARADRKTTAMEAVSVTCSDGSMSKSGRGACSGHGGIKAMAAAPAGRREMTKPGAAAGQNTMATGSGGKEDNNPSGAIAKCKDGMYSHSTHRQGACSRHGGVASWS